MKQGIDVEVELDSGRRINQQWTKEKLAFYILSSDVGRPKFTNAAKEEWVTNYIMRARWDKQSLTEVEFENLIAKWPREVPRSLNPDDAKLVRILYDFRGQRQSCGMNREDNPDLFAKILAESARTAKYVKLNYGRGESEYDIKIPRRFVGGVLRVYGFEEPNENELAPLVDGVLFAVTYPNWKSPFTFVMQEAAL